MSSWMTKRDIFESIKLSSNISYETVVRFFYQATSCDIFMIYLLTGKYFNQKDFSVKKSNEFKYKKQFLATNHFYFVLFI